MKLEFAITITLAIGLIFFAGFSALLLCENAQLKQTASVHDLYEFYKTHIQDIGESWEDFSCEYGDRPFSEIQSKFGLKP